MRTAMKELGLLVLGLVFACPASAQTTQQKPELLLFHASGPLPCYEVATVKPVDPESAGAAVRLAHGDSLNPLGIRQYIMLAYGAIYSPQVMGGPDWLNKDS